MRFKPDLYKGNQERYLLKAVDQIKQLLEDQLANLQTVSSSRYAAAFHKEIDYWQKATSTISDCVECWLVVQMKWTYLEGIFLGSEDIRI